MPEAVVGRTTEPQVPRLGAAAKRKGNDVVELQQEAGPAAPPAVRIDVTAAAAVAAPHLAPHRCRNVSGSTRPVGRLRATSGRAGCLWLRPRMAIELRHSCPLRWRRSAATAIRRCQRGGHALVCQWRRYGGVGPTIGRRLRRRCGCIGRSRRWLGTHRGAAAASLASRRRRGQRCHRRGARAANPARGFLCGPRCRRLAAAAVERVAAEGPRGFLCGPRWRRGCCHGRSCPPASAALRVALARPASPAKPPRPPALPAPLAPSPGPRLPPGAHLRARTAVAPGRSAAGRPAPAAPRAAPRSGAGPRATAVPVAARCRADRQRRSPPSAASGPRPAPACAQPAAPAREPPRPTTASPRACSCRSPAPPAPAAAPPPAPVPVAPAPAVALAPLPRSPKAPAPGAVPVAPGSSAAAAGAEPRSTVAVAARCWRSKVFCNCAAALRVSEPSCSRSRVPAVSAHRHGLDTAPGGAFAVAQFAHRVVEQAGAAEAQVQVARLDLAQVVEDGELQRLLVQDEGPGVRQQHLVGEPGEGGGEAGSGRGSHWGKYKHG